MVYEYSLIQEWISFFLEATNKEQVQKRQRRQREYTVGEHVRGRRDYNWELSGERRAAAAHPVVARVEDELVALENVAARVDVVDGHLDRGLAADAAVPVAGHRVDGAHVQLQRVREPLRGVHVLDRSAVDIGHVLDGLVRCRRDDALGGRRRRDCGVVVVRGRMRGLWLMWMRRRRRGRECGALWTHGGATAARTAGALRSLIKPRVSGIGVGGRRGRHGDRRGHTQWERERCRGCIRFVPLRSGRCCGRLRQAQNSLRGCARTQRERHEDEKQKPLVARHLRYLRRQKWKLTSNIARYARRQINQWMSNEAHCALQILTSYSLNSKMIIWTNKYSSAQGELDLKERVKVAKWYRRSTTVDATLYFVNDSDLERNAKIDQ